MNISLTPEIEQLIQKKIDSGMYSSASEVILDALQRMDDEDCWKGLRDFLAPRIAAAEAGNIITQDFDSIINEVKNKK